MKARLCHCLILVFTIHCAGNVTTSAAPAAEWTSSDGRAIQAGFIGVGAQSVLIEKDGVVFHVPFSRLAPQSIEQAKRLGGLAGRKAGEAAAVCRPGTTPVSPPRISPFCTLSLAGRTATPTTDVPSPVRKAVEAGNFLQTKPYLRGGGHGAVIDRGYDCSGSVSHVLIQAGLLTSPLTSGGFSSYGLPGPGRWISIHARPGHVFMTICGLRLDTGGRGGRGDSGPRWCVAPRGGPGWTVRHPPGM